MIPIRDSLRSKNKPLACWLLMAACGAVFYHELTLSSEGLGRFLGDYALVPQSFGGSFRGWIRLVTMQFLHGGWLHLIGNLWFLHLFGDNVEDRMGSWNFLRFYLVCGVIAGLLHLHFNSGSPLPALGASGAISGVLGAYIMMFPAAKLEVFFLLVIFPIRFTLPAVIYLGLWFYLQYSSATLSLGLPGSSSGVAFWAHVGGFLAGLLLHPLFLKKQAQ